MEKNINPALPVKAVKMLVRIMSFPMGPVITAGKIAGRLLHMYRKCPCGRWKYLGPLLVLCGTEGKNEKGEYKNEYENGDRSSTEDLVFLLVFYCQLPGRI